MPLGMQERYIRGLACHRAPMYPCSLPLGGLLLLQNPSRQVLRLTSRNDMMVPRRSSHAPRSRAPPYRVWHDHIIPEKRSILRGVTHIPAHVDNAYILNEVRLVNIYWEHSIIVRAFFVGAHFEPGTSCDRTPGSLEYCTVAVEAAETDGFGARICQLPTGNYCRMCRRHARHHLVLPSVPIVTNMSIWNTRMLPGRYPQS